MKSIHVGAGGWGGVWTERITRHPAWEIAGLVDISGTVLEREGERHDIPPERRFGDLTSALKSVEADAVFVSTPNTHHHDYVIEALEAGRHVMVDKALAYRFADGVAMLNAARESGKVCAVGQNYRYFPASVLIKRLITEGKLGNLDNALTIFRLPVNQIGSYRMDLEHGLIVDGAVHHCDLVRYFCGSNPVTVQAHAWHPSWARYAGYGNLAALVEFEEGFLWDFFADTTCHDVESGWPGNWRIEGDAGAVRVDHLWRQVLYAARDDSLINQPETRDYELLAFPASPDSVTVLLNQFTAAIREGVPCPTSIEDNIFSFALVLSLIQAADTGQRVDIAEFMAEAGYVPPR